MSWLSDFFSDGNWIAPLVTAGATIYAANAAADANKEAARLASEGAQRQAEAIQQGNTLAQQRFEAVQDQTRPAVDYQTGVVAGSKALTPYQQAQLEDARRQTVNALSVSGLRGSGRATVAAVRDVEGRLAGQFLDQNQRRADTAASGLAGQHFGAATNAANLDASTGRAVGGASYDAALTAADSTIADASLRGRALGDIATIINDSWKEGRKSSYGQEQKVVGEDAREKRPTL